MLELANLLERGIPKKKKLARVFEESLEILKKHNAIILHKFKYYLHKDYCIGTFSPTKQGYGYVIPLNGSQDILIEKTNTNNATKDDIVLTKITTNSRKKKGKIITKLQTTQKYAICYIEKYKNNYIAISIPNELAYKIKASKKSLDSLPKDTIIKINQDNGEIVEILGAMSDPKIDEKISLSLYDKHEGFSLNSEIESQSFKEARLKDFKERVDLSSLPFCVIDPDDAKDHDDAICYIEDKSTLYIAIADVSYYVKEESPLDEDARHRAFSIYFPHKSIPMLPRILSEGLCSLQQNKLRLAMVWKIKLHKKNLSILNSELFEAVIKVKSKLTYNQVDEFFDTNKKIKGTNCDMLLSLKDTTQKLRAKRLKSGFDFRNDETRLELDKNQELKSIKQSKQTASHQLIEECMLLANIQSAKLLESKNTKVDSSLKLGIYRIHASPKKESLQNLFLELRLLGIWDKGIPAQKDLHKTILKIQKIANKKNLTQEVDKLIIKSMQQANYASHNIGHFGLGFESYSHFTSPIRRYSDLVLHRILKQKIKLEENITIKESLPMLCEHLNKEERNIAKIEWDFNDRKFARFLNTKISQSFDGIIIDEQTPQLVSLRHKMLLGARVIALKGKGVKYQKVRIQIIDVNLKTAKVYGRIVECYNEILGQNYTDETYIKNKILENKKNLKQKAKINAKQIKQNIKNKPKKSKKRYK
ncbi:MULTISPECIES: RNB domain-containing ribonuclease [Helicobacter]|uniref:Ribonuclease R n=1 Tax=Helicobacter ibis TaxID=2962633 RepID=A0ABT4VET7_9HELI|nr:MULTISPECIES: ribonuclease R family protein [Helicobacter]MDA3967061.1 ribonuclease R [Helicobacter sp. WB40]MDA3969195.1 ribonuclease R [Helicobacter ibis]